MVHKGVSNLNTLLLWSDVSYILSVTYIFLTRRLTLLYEVKRNIVVHVSSDIVNKDSFFPFMNKKLFNWWLVDACSSIGNASLVRNLQVQHVDYLWSVERYHHVFQSPVTYKSLLIQVQLCCQKFQASIKFTMLKDFLKWERHVSSLLRSWSMQEPWLGWEISNSHPPSHLKCFIWIKFKAE